jgi:hypothetical protein
MKTDLKIEDPNSIAIIIDNQVVAVMDILDQTTYYALISNPIIIDLKDNQKNVRVGFMYNEEDKSLSPIKPYPSWILSEDGSRYIPPVPYPENAHNQTHEDGIFYIWVEKNQEWVKKLYPSWGYDEVTEQWVPPKPYPLDGDNYTWVEPQKEWIKIN